MLKESFSDSPDCVHPPEPTSSGVLRANVLYKSSWTKGVVTHLDSQTRTRQWSNSVQALLQRQWSQNEYTSVSFKPELRLQYKYGIC